jgi:hypothetical protein
MAAAKTVVATTHFSVAVGDEEVFVHAGERFSSTHPVVKANPGAFAPEHADIKRAA